MSFFKKLFGRGKKEEQVEEVVVQETTKQAEEEATQEAEQEVVEQDAREAEEKAAAEAAAREAEEKAAAEAAARKAEEKAAAEVAARKAEEKAAAERAAREAEEKAEQAAREAEEKAAEQAAREAEEKAAAEAAREAEEKAAAEAAREAEEKAAAEKAALEAEEKVVAEEVAMPSSEAVQEETTVKKKGFIKRLFSGLAKTRDNILKGVDEVLSNFKHIDEDLYEELEEALIMADFGVDTTLKIMESLKQKVKEHKITDPSLLKGTLQDIIRDMLIGQPEVDLVNNEGPTVVLVIGVNGVGKTTSIGKMAHLLKGHDKKVLIAAADTFRAAAIEQLQVWADRAGVDIIKHDEGTDAAAVVFDAIAAAKSRHVDVLICDTAGRLQNKTNLMRELEKISRIIEREYPEAKKEILIALDATTGQNAIQQVKLFKEVANINGIILTKLDGTAKGGAIVGIYENLKVPVKYIGVGEKIDDLQPFDAQSFADALFKSE